MRITQLRVEEIQINSYVVTSWSTCWILKTRRKSETDESNGTSHMEGLTLCC